MSWYVLSGWLCAIALIGAAYTGKFLLCEANSARKKYIVDERERTGDLWVRVTALQHLLELSHHRYVTPPLVDALAARYEVLERERKAAEARTAAQAKARAQVEAAARAKADAERCARRRSNGRMRDDDRDSTSTGAAAGAAAYDNRYDDHYDNYSDSTMSDPFENQVNPTTGLPMISGTYGGADVSGHSWGAGSFGGFD
jgi:hypothetical protein